MARSCKNFVGYCPFYRQHNYQNLARIHQHNSQIYRNRRDGSWKFSSLIIINLLESLQMNTISSMPFVRRESPTKCRSFLRPMGRMMCNSIAFCENYHTMACDLGIPGKAM